MNEFFSKLEYAVDWLYEFISKVVTLIEGLISVVENSGVTGE